MRVRCTGRIDTTDILHAFRTGADAVMVVGCKFGECDFENGNFAAKRHVDFTKRILDHIGAGSERVEMFFCSAAESDKLIAAINEMTHRVELLPLNNLKYQ